MEHRWLRGNSSWRWIKRQQGRPEQLPMSSGSQAMWITALGMGGPWEVIEESLCNLWKSRIKGTVPENPKWENAPSFKNGAVRNHQVTTVSSSCPGDVPLEDWAAPGSPQEAQPHPAPPPPATHTQSSFDFKSSWQDSPLGINPMNTGPAQPCFTTFLASLTWVIILSLVIYIYCTPTICYATIYVPQVLKLLNPQEYRLSPDRDPKTSVWKALD